MRRALLLVLLLVLPAFLAGIHAAETDLYSSMWDRGVVVVLYGNQYGTGWWVDRQYVVTAAHVVDWRSGVKVTLLHGDYQAVGYVVYTDSVHDIAIIRAEKPPAYQYIWTLSIDDPEKGERIFVIGYPFELYKIVGDIGVMSSNPRVAEGIVAWVYPDRQLFEFQAPTDAGNSGGPIVDVSGNVVGLVSFALEGRAATMYYGTCVSAIKEALSRAGVRYRTGLSSIISGSGSGSILQPALVAALVGGIAAIVTTAIVVPSLRRWRR